MAAPVFAQAPSADLRIVHFTPSDSGTPSSIIAVTFNRPVAGIPAQTVEAREVMSIAPAVPGVFEWRDSVTIRFIPQTPFAPGTQVAVRLDTAAIASGGVRHAARYELPVRFTGARPLAMMVDEHLANTDWPAGPHPVFRVLYSTVVDLDSVARRTRLVFPAGCGGTIPLKPLRQRGVRAGEGNPIERAGGLQRDTVADRYRRVVELEPTDSLPPNCLGMWHVASFDPTRPIDAWRYGIRTAPPFVLKSLNPCLLSSFNAAENCASDGLSFVFSADVSADAFAKHVHISPAIPGAGIKVPAGTIFQLPAAMKPGAEYTVTFDSTFSDVFGRRLNGPLEYRIVAHQRP